MYHIHIAFSLFGGSGETSSSQVKCSIRSIVDRIGSLARRWGNIHVAFSLIGGSGESGYFVRYQ